MKKIRLRKNMNYEENCNKIMSLILLVNGGFKMVPEKDLVSHCCEFLNAF